MVVATLRKRKGRYEGRQRTRYKNKCEKCKGTGRVAGVRCAVCATVKRVNNAGTRKRRVRAGTGRKVQVMQRTVRARQVLVMCEEKGRQCACVRAKREKGKPAGVCACAGTTRNARVQAKSVQRVTKENKQNQTQVMNRRCVVCVCVGVGIKSVGNVVVYV